MKNRGRDKKYEHMWHNLNNFKVRETKETEAVNRE